ncbi:sulfatase [Niabella ginsenosidivorans]|uniref:Sulfatase n=1 Tax=Niabella ginsenosidivorans TaxID=1176587 RepID=A0A1A9HZ12_9BACT|nr:sulfatase [Niabella ginsenosidivorans]ANH80503.1 sulfatase [Niabella ginsenosidivorans]
MTITQKIKSLPLTFLLLFFTAVNIFGQKPNIVLIISDDHACQAISAYGSRLTQTPNIDRLAKEGAIFNNAYVTNSLCGPSRASILTGTYSNINGFKDNISYNFDFNQPSFVKALQAAGYQTAWIGKMHLGDSIPQGLDYYNILPGQGQYYNPDFIRSGNVQKRYTGYVTNIIEALSNEWLDHRDRQKPFCLIIGHKATHRVWMPDLEDLGSFDDKTFDLPHDFYDDYATRKAAAVQDMTIAKTMRMGHDLKMYDPADSATFEDNIKRMNADQKAKWFAYYAKIKKDLDAKRPEGRALTEWKYQRYLKDYLATAASMDRNIGKTLDYLDKNGLSKNTIVIYMSDQGFYMGEHGWFDKRFMYEESFRTPMVMRYPGVIKPGTAINDFIMNIDLAPTLIEAGKGQAPAPVQGRSFLPLLKNQHYTARDAMYYHYYENGEHSVSPHFGIRTKRYKLIRFYKRVESWELFDLQKDPHELHNIYDEPGSKPVIADLKAKLLKLITAYKDTEAAAIFARAI